MATINISKYHGNTSSVNPNYSGFTKWFTFPQCFHQHDPASHTPRATHRARQGVPSLILFDRKCSIQL